MTIYAVHTTDTGQLVSIGTRVADPLPANLTALALTDAEAAAMRAGNARWDAPTRTVVILPPDPSEANTLDINTKIRAAIAGNVTALTQLDNARTAVGTVITDTAGNLAQANAQIDQLANVIDGLLVQSGRMMRQITAMERLVVGSDLLLETTGT